MNFVKPSNLAIFEQKAWAIAHGFNRFWVIFTPFLKFMIFVTPSELAIFEQKAWAIAHGFVRFWVIFTPFLKIYDFCNTLKIGHF